MKTSSQAGVEWLKALAEHPVPLDEYMRIPKKVRATLSNAPCTAQCWHAEGNICICSCGGKHHGIGYNPSDAPQPKEAA